MNILIPMAGEGKRFLQEGYRVSKPAIPTYYRKTGQSLPMVVCAALDLPQVEEAGKNIIFVERDSHKKDGTEEEVRKYFPKAKFISVGYLTDGQASTCLLAGKFIDNGDELLIAGCDNGMDFDIDKFKKEKATADALVFTYRHNEAVLESPDSYGWMVVGADNIIREVSVKKAVSANPMEDHAVVATFWFRHGRDFVSASKKMIDEDDRINGEFYVDEAIRHFTANKGKTAKIFEIDRYIGWGTPKDYRNYQRTFEYWRGFCMDEHGKLSRRQNFG